MRYLFKTFDMKTSSNRRPSKSNGHSHSPSLKCHEEIMIKCSSNGELVCCSDNASDKSKSNKLTKKERKTKTVISKPANVKFKDVFETVSAPVENALRNTCSKGGRSKSVPLISNHKFEDSIDFIPVKLSSDNDLNKQRTQNYSKSKQNVKSIAKSKLSQVGRTRPTWDKLLRGDSDDLYQSNQLIDKNKKPKHGRNINNDHQANEGSTNKSEKSQYNVSSTLNHNTDCSNKVLNSHNSENICLNELPISDPASTLDFLIKQLRGRLMNQPENEKLQTIIMDMENALLKISDKNQEFLNKGTGKSLFNYLPQSSNNVAFKNGDLEENYMKSDHNNVNVVTQLKTKLEESCMYLQSLCVQREHCRNKTQEKEQLTIQLAESRRLLAIAKSKEKEYEIKIGEFRLRLQEADSKTSKQNENIQVLNDSILKLKAENEILRSFKESAKRLNVRLKEISSEREILQSKLGLKELEVEKLKFLLGAKENLNPDYSHEKEKQCTQFNGPDLDFNITEKNKDISSLSTATSYTQQNVIIACSSQASSSPRHSPSPYNSWQHISSICQQAAAASELNNGISGIFQNLQSKTDQIHPPHLELELLSSNNSFWSDNEDQDGKSKIAISDIETESLSS